MVKYNADGNYLMSGHSDRSIKLWNANKGSLIKTYAGVHNREVFDVAIFQDNSKFASCGGDKVFYVWDVISGKYTRKIVAHQSRINTMALNQYENVIATGSFDNSVKLWDLLSNTYRPIQVLDDFKDSITKVAFTDEAIVCGSVDGYIRVYDVRMGRLVRFSVESPVNSFDIGVDKKFLAVSTLSSTIKLIDITVGDVVAEYRGKHKSDQYISGVKFSKDNTYLY